MIDTNKTYLVGDNSIVIEEYYIAHNGDWYDRNQIQQVRNGWTLNAKTGSNSAGGTWNEPEHLFRWDSTVSDSHNGESHFPVGENGILTNEHGYCIKCFSSHRAWWIEEHKNEVLPIGKYKVELNYYDDNFMDYVDGQKISPTDPLSFEVKLNLGDQTSGWTLSNFQTENTIMSTFEITESGQAGFEMRGRWGLMNVGVFLRYFKVTKIDDIPEPEPETLEEHLVNFTKNQQVIDYNSLAAIEKEIVSDSFTPYSQEKWETYDDTNYSVQGSRQLSTPNKRVYYATVGEWGTIDYIIQDGVDSDIKLDITTKYSQRNNRWSNEKLGA